MKDDDTVGSVCWNQLLIYSIASETQIDSKPIEEDNLQRIFYDHESKLVFIGTSSGTVAVYDTDTYERRHTFSAGDGKVSCIVSKEGLLVVSAAKAGSGGKIHWHSYKNGQLDVSPYLTAEVDYKYSIRSLSILPNDDVVGYEDKLVRYDGKTGEQCATCKVHFLTGGTAVGLNGSCVMVGHDEHLTVHDPVTLEEVGKVLGFQANTTKISTSVLEGRIRIAIAGANFSDIALMDVTDVAPEQSEAWAEPLSVCMSKTPDGSPEALYVCKERKALYSLDPITSEMAVKSEAEFDLRHVRASEDGKVVLAVGTKGIASWSSDGTSLGSIQLEKGFFKLPWLSPDGSAAILRPNGDGSIIVLQVSPLEILEEYDDKKDTPGHTDEVTGVAWSPDCKTAITGSDDNNAIIWSATTGDIVKELKGHQDYISSVAFGPSGSHLVATCSEEDGTWIWNTETAEVVRKIPQKEDYTSNSVTTRNYMDWDHKNNLIVTASFKWNTRVINPDTGETICSFPRGIYHPRFIREGQLIAGVVKSGLKLYNPRNGQLVANVYGADTRAGVATWSCTDDYFATMATFSRANEGLIYDLSKTPLTIKD